MHFSSLVIDTHADTTQRLLDPHFDLGALCYGIVLAAWDRGLGSVINGQGIMRSDIVREVADIPEDEVIMTCVAMGYPDESFAANAVNLLSSGIQDLGDTLETVSVKR